MMPDLEKAAYKAAETLIRHNVSSAPVDPMPILKSLPNTVVVSFVELGQRIGIDRSNVIGTFAAENHDAVTVYKELHGKPSYIVVYNQRLPFYMMQRALARELGHIVLGHDGTRPESVRMEEAITFARHLLCPRPLIRAIQESGISITTELLGNVTGCYERCLAGLRTSPGAHVPADFNRIIRDQFSDYVDSLIDFYPTLSAEDRTAPADLGTFMDNYVE